MNGKKREGHREGRKGGTLHKLEEGRRRKRRETRKGKTRKRKE